ncbi:glutamic acid-rich protein isoform X2 [Stomoxys calcitrans]|nr:glutamic acid-rich protein isoform X2 [Stomoxys calcitrans]
MHKAKKKTAKLPKPIKVKKEKSDEDRLPQPMSHYIDDRLEMVKQIFGSLKPKTIINLAPEFLKTQGLEEIEEACLNELLCISTKRLKSIITATKCPTDTESSEDDDVQRHEEHVSLEEISSDSEIEGGTSKKGKRKKPKADGVDKNKLVAKNDTPKTTEPNAEDGQISVLELLELQARARAIRSQLALEPVTKIEVDSDDEGENGKHSKKDKSSSKTERKRTSSARESQDSSNPAAKPIDNESEMRKTKKVKLKRNYRNSSTQNKNEERTRDGGECNDNHVRNDSSAEKPRSQEKDIGFRSEQKNAGENIKREKSSRSPSPDVIPIVAEPETLLINDSSEEDMGNGVESKQHVEVVQVNKETSTEVARDRKKSETEEGELNDDDNVKSTQNPQALDKCKDTKKTVDLREILVDNRNKVGKLVSDEKKSENMNSEAIVDNSNTSASTNMTMLEEEEDDQNDDIISLGEDLEDEMDEQLESEVSTKQSSFVTDGTENNSAEQGKKSKKKKYGDDNRSEDNQSWHSRYMKSSKVSKVLAASRLGKRVRDKIKKSKEASREDSDKPEKQEEIFTSKHEDGSLEQYKELLELRQRKPK